MRRTVLWVGLVVLAALVAALAYGCGETSFGSCADNGTCVPDGGRDTGPDVAIDGEITPATDAGGGDDGSTTLPDGTVGTGDGAVACDTSKEPGQAPCLLDVAYGVFVSATGQDDAGADETHPLRTITEGIEAAARTNKSRVFVCNGNYAEQVSLDAQHGGISLYGGFDCSNQWAYVGATTKAHVQGPTVLYALRVNGTTQPIVIADITFTVGDASGLDTAGNGNSSVAAFVSNESAGVSFHRVSFQAGAGVDGKGGGTPATNLFSGNVADLQGNTASGMMGGPAKTCACKVFGSSQGGSGGVAGDPADDGGTGTATPPAVPAPPRNGVG
ncbi:MAG TPA: hypothetical protein VH044_05125, partial [Polyangiaceae bacterium]|nr:hypothetical protein [Polyangiaceae bacterium]